MAQWWRFQYTRWAGSLKEKGKLGANWYKCKIVMAQFFPLFVKLNREIRNLILIQWWTSHLHVLCALLCPILCAIPWIIVTRLFCPWDFPGQETLWILSCLPGILPSPWSNPPLPVSTARQAVFFTDESWGKHSHLLTECVDKRSSNLTKRHHIVRENWPSKQFEYLEDEIKN